MDKCLKNCLSYIFALTGILCFPWQAFSQENIKQMTLPECLTFMKENHPRVKAAEASLRAALAGHEGLNHLPLYARLSPDLKYRKQQSQISIEVNDAALQQQIRDTAYGVAHCYYLVVYAGKQKQLAEEIIQVLEKNINALEIKVKLTKNALDQKHLQELKLGLVEAKDKQALALTGYDRAKSALMEEMGGRYRTGNIVPKDTELPEFKIMNFFEKDFVIDITEKSVNARLESIKSSRAVDITSLEVDAQNSARFAPKFRTFANGSDLHYIPIGVQSRGEDFTPEQITIEMPPNLVGKRTYRVQSAQAYHDRAVNVNETTRKLIRLEVGNGFQQLKETHLRYLELKKHQPTLKNNLDNLANKPLKFLTEEEAGTFERAGRMLGNYNQTLLISIDNVIDLERATNGIFSLGFTCPSTHTMDGLPVERK